jgi:hypothetical protein
MEQKYRNKRQVVNGYNTACLHWLYAIKRPPVLYLWSCRTHPNTVRSLYAYKTVRISASDNIVWYGPRTSRIDTVYYRKYFVLNTFTNCFRIVNHLILIDLAHDQTYYEFWWQIRWKFQHIPPTKLGGFCFCSFFYTFAIIYLFVFCNLYKKEWIYE